ncbi:MAG: FadR/GntR family transcriptional regulator [Paracoccus sp. (in: a-proteobacteria)]|uniref:FadR/GntR family transcriptional regulator n=1 Tax=Paracoccus sp. TaxID=267 RepID=UPI0039E669F7
MRQTGTEIARMGAKVSDWLTRKAPIHRKNAAEMVFEDLRAAILAGEVSVGTRLPSEEKLARSYGVSRPIIREAMRSLQTLGLTRSRSGSGSFVISNMQHADLVYGNIAARDLIEARAHIEVPAAGWAALRRTEAQARLLAALCDQMEQPADGPEWVALDSEFHNLVAQASRNALFVHIVAESRDALRRQSELVDLMADRRVGANHEHRRIAEAIAAGLESEARVAMQDHLDRVTRAMTWITAA